jgi:post-segregation antitoxin (ccd killing protein)
VYTRRMPRMQVYLPSDLYEIVKERRLSASELLQEAVRTEMRRRKLRAASRRYTAELVSQVGQPAPRERARAVAVAQRIAGRTDRKAG